MKYIQLLAFASITLFFVGCNQDKDQLTIIDSSSFPNNQITLGDEVIKYLTTDQLSTKTGKNLNEQNPVWGKMEEMIQTTKNVSKLKTDSTWKALLSEYEDFRINHIGTNGIPIALDSLTEFESTALARKWVELNVCLLKLSGEVRFGDALEKILYDAKVPVLSAELLKSIIYTHNDDQIYLNIFGSSSLVHHHTTGGIIKLIQETSYPASNEITLKCETNDVRYLNLFIRIPSWAVNPTVTHGNVKYVPHPGEYCQISRMWKDGDEIRIVLKNK